MKRLSIILALVVVFSIGAFAQSSPREEGVGSSFMANDNAGELYVAAFTDQNPQYSGGSPQEGAATMFTPFSQQMQEALVPVITDTTVDPAGQDR